MLKMIAVDLDGTLLSEKSNLPRRNIDALKRAMDAGVLVTIATGRMIEATLPIARAIGVNAPISLFNGAMAYDMEKDAVIDGITIPKELAVELLKTFEENGVYVQSFTGRGFCTERYTALTEYYENKIGVKATVTGRKLSEILDAPVYKLLCLGESAQLEGVIRDLAPRFPQVSMVKSGERHLEVIMAGVDKGAGLKAVCRSVGVTPEEVLAFGDEGNDLPLLKAAGTPFVMENASDTIKSGFKNIAPKNTDCGVARIVEKYLDEGLLGGKR